MSASNFTSSAQGWDLDILGGLISSNSKELQKWKVKAHLRNFCITLEEFLILMKFNFIFFFLLRFVHFVSYWKKFCQLISKLSMSSFRANDLFQVNFLWILCGCLFVLLIVSFVYRNFLVWCSSTCLFLLLFAVHLVPYPINHW